MENWSDGAMEKNKGSSLRRQTKKPKDKPRRVLDLPNTPTLQNAIHSSRAGIAI
jgi:hypothetical protein